MVRRCELIKPLERPPADADTPLAGLTIRAREPRGLRANCYAHEPP